MLLKLCAALPLLVVASAAMADANADLLTAVNESDSRHAIEALAQGADANTRGAQQASALMLAAEHGDIATMRALLGAGADVNAVRAGGLTPLMHAAASGEPAAVKLLLEARAPVNPRATTSGMTALRAAVATGAADSAKLLLAAGANRNEVDGSGARLLFTAAGSGSVELLELFLTRGENVNRKRAAGGFTALDVALERQHWAAAEYLLNHGATLSASVAGKNQALLKLLDTESVVQPRKPNPLVQAADLPSVALFKAMLAQGASTTFTDAKGNTLLMLAAKKHHVTALEALVAAGLDVDARNAEGDTALTIAAGRSEYELVVVGIGLALGQTREAVTRLMFRPTPKSSESVPTARRLQAARVLLDARANPNAADNSGDTPLLKATRTGDAELVALLIAAGADVNARSTTGSSPLLVAAQFGLAEIATALVRARADPAIRDGDGRSPLELATLGRHESIVRLLQQDSAG